MEQLKADRVLVAVVDAGGSKTRAGIGLVSEQGVKLLPARGTAGPGNPIAGGWDEAAANWESAIRQAMQGLQDVSADLNNFGYVVFGVAGAGRPEVAREVLDWIAWRFPQAVSAVVPDVALLVAAGSSDGTGIALVAGTGSLAWGINQNGEVARAGGWGFYLGDEGSGAWIGKAALALVVKAADGLAPPTALTNAVLADLNLPSVESLVSWAPAAWRSPRVIAALAPTVIRCAEAGDKQAGEIIELASRQLARLVDCVARKLGGADRPVTLAMGGGLLVNCAMIREKILVELAAAGGEYQLLVVEDPLFGASRIAEKLLARALWKHWRFTSTFRPI